LTPEQIQEKKVETEKKEFDKEEEEFENSMLVLVNK